MVKECCRFSNINVFLKNFPHWSMLCFLHAFFSSAHTDKKNPLARLTNKHTKSEICPNRVPIELSRIAFPIIVLPKDDHTNCVQEERLGLPCWTCEGGGDIVGVVTHLVRGSAQVLHGDQVVELSVLLEMHEKEEEGEDGERQIEVESERGELKERHTWMTMRMR